VGSIHFVRIAAHLTVTLSAEALERHAPASPIAVGQALADAVDACVRERGLGYYPALGYFREVGGVDESLLDAASNLGWLAGELAAEEVRRRLRQVFSHVELDAVAPIAFNLPPVRPSHPRALQRLARHYAPDTVKVALILTSLQRQSAPVGMEEFVRRTLWRWLRERFAAMDVASARLV
jgi:hypothetical protein